MCNFESVLIAFKLKGCREWSKMQGMFVPPPPPSLSHIVILNPHLTIGVLSLGAVFFISASYITKEVECEVVGYLWGIWCSW